MADIVRIRCLVLMKNCLLQGFLGFLLVSLSGGNLLAESLSDNIRISSQFLEYDLQYRIYTPASLEPGRQYPVLLVTDGQLYIHQLNTVEVASRLMDSGAMRPAFIVFIDPRDPDDLAINRRHAQFMCNADYARFLTGELLPALIQEHPISAARDDTNVLGLSFGAINAACLGAMVSSRYSGIGMHSPGNDQHIKEMARLYQKSETEPLRIFLSAGTVNDNFRAARRFRDVLEEKGYDVTWVENKGKSHNFENWRVLVDDALITLLPPGP